MKISDLESRPNNLSFNNLCTSLSPPVGCRTFLGLNLKLCISRPTPDQDTNNTIHCLLRTVRIRDMLENMVSDEQEEYIQKLYIQWDGNPPHIERGPAKSAMLAFSDTLEARKTFHARTAFKRWNLSCPQRKALKTIVSDRCFIIVMSANFLIQLSWNGLLTWPASCLITLENQRSIPASRRKKLSPICRQFVRNPKTCSISNVHTC